MSIQHKIILTFSFIILSLSTVFAQAPDTLWTRTYGGAEEDGGYSICFNGENGYVISGYTESYGAGDYDVYLIKTTTSGDTIWTKTYGGVNEEIGRCIRRTSDEGFIIVGNTGSFPTSSSLLIIRTDIEGNSLWTKIYGPSSVTAGYSVQQTPDSGFIISGIVGDVHGIFLAKTDSLGDTLWTNIYVISYNAYGLSVIQTSNGDYMVAGCSGAGTCETSWNVNLVKTDSLGNEQWIKVYGIPSFGYDDVAYSVQQISDDNYIVGGFTTSRGESDCDFWLLKIDDMGDTLWTRTYGGNLTEYCFSAVQTEDGGYVMTGFTESFGAGGRDVYIVRTDPIGDTIWTKTIGGPNDDVGRQILVTNKGGYVIVGYTESFGAGGRDVYLIKLAPDPAVYIERQDILIPQKFVLYQNCPNPFNALTTISYTIPYQSDVTIDIYDILGRKVKTLVSRHQPAGYHRVIWQADEFSTGIYFYKLQAGDYIETKKMMLLK